MRTDELHLRDPYVLVYDEKYYIYGTRGETAWGAADGFDCYIGDDLKHWNGPFEVFRNNGSFWADRNYWAPECVRYGDAFYLFATFKSSLRHMGVQSLRSESPCGPFLPHSDAPLTPETDECLDGTLFIDSDAVPWLVYSHSFLQNPRGGMCALPLTADLRAPAGKPITLFYAADAPWAVPFPYAKAEFGCETDVFLSDGPCLYRTAEGKLLLLWSSFGRQGYAMGVAEAINGTLRGGWRHYEQPLFSENGGHGMLFNDRDGNLTLTLHQPNDSPLERPAFIGMREINGRLERRNEEILL